MDPALARPPAPVAFEDGLGERHHTLDAAGKPLELLTLRKELAAAPSFEFALRERASRLAGFRHACYGQVRGVERLTARDGATLALVSDRVLGVRLSTILAVAERQLLPLEIEAGLCLIRQLVEAVSLLHQEIPDVAHGAISPERIVITPDARLVIVEHVLGAALGQLDFTRERYWKELRIPLPARAGILRLDRRADVTQVGAIALALILGRPLGQDDYPGRIGEIASRIGAVSANGGLEPLPAPVRSWLSRALQLDPRNSFASAVEARTELQNVLAETDYTAAPTALESFLAQYYSCVEADRTPDPLDDSLDLALPASTPKKPDTPSSPQTPKLVVGASRPEPPVPPAVPVVTGSGNAVQPAGPAAPVKQEPPAPQRSIDVRLSIEKPKEAELEMPTTNGPSRRRSIAVAAVLIALAGGGLLAGRRYLVPAASAEATGTLVVTTEPAGVGVVIDGKNSGLTPVTVELTPGDHVVELVTESTRRQVPISIAAGGHVSQFFDMPKSAPGTGTLQVRTEPSGAKVTVDGQLFGRSPVAVEGLAPGTHTVTLENELGSVKQEVTIEAGATASLVVPMTAPQGAPVSGWIAVAAPVDVQLYENGRLLGTNKTERIMVPVGRHQIEIVNETLGYRATQVVQVTPGQLATIRPEWPKGTLALNALPWADVVIDGKPVGETPIGEVSLPIGQHEVVFRHPELGEDRHIVTVTTTPGRLTTDLRKR